MLYDMDNVVHSTYPKRKPNIVFTLLRENAEKSTSRWG